MSVPELPAAIPVTLIEPFSVAMIARRLAVPVPKAVPLKIRALSVSANTLMRPIRDEIIDAQVVAQGSDGNAVTTLTMRLSTPFGRLMRVWCERMHIPNDEVRFTVDDAEIEPGDTPGSCGWTSVQGILTVRAAPRTQEID